MWKPLFDGAGVYSQSHWRSLIHRCNAVCGICTAVSIATDVTAVFIVMRKKGATYIKKALFYGYFSIVSPLFLLPRLSCHEGIFSDTACLGVKVLSPDMFATINKEPGLLRRVKASLALTYQVPFLVSGSGQITYLTAT